MDSGEELSRVSEAYAASWIIMILLALAQSTVLR